MFVIYDKEKQRVPIKIWLEGKDSLESKCLEQALNVSNHPAIFHHVSLMPDTHMGYAMPIGGVAALQNAVSPYFVGVDIGCGIIYVKTNVWADTVTKPKLREIINKVKENIPMGMGSAHCEKQEWEEFDKYISRQGDPGSVINWYDEKIWDTARKSLGTLGSGNHYLQASKDNDGYLSLMIHSGSRNLGYKIADYYHKFAVKYNHDWHSNLPNDECAFFPTESLIGAAYLHDMNFALSYAQENRNRMMIQFKKAVVEVIENVDYTIPKVKFTDEVNIHHNFASLENHFGKNVWVHRKGATQAKKGQLGIIPGSMGTKSYIVRGLGNPDSWMSCFHGDTYILTKKGLISIKDIFNSKKNVFVASYNSMEQKFEFKKVIDKSCRKALINNFSVSQTGKRENNLIHATPDHPFATYNNSQIIYQKIRSLVKEGKGVISPTHIFYKNSDIIKDYSFYYLLGVILSDGCIYKKEWDKKPSQIGRPREKKYKRSYIRIFQKISKEKKNFIKVIIKLMKKYSNNNTYSYVPRPRTIYSKKYKRQIFCSHVATIGSSSEKLLLTMEKEIEKLPKILLSDRNCALHFLSGFIDGDGNYSRGQIHISIGKKNIFLYLIPSLLCLGVAYRVYNNRKNYALEFRDNNILEEIKNICQRVQIKNVPDRKYSDKLFVAKDILTKKSCDYVKQKAKKNRLVGIDKISNAPLDKKLSMQRIKSIKGENVEDVYNLTIKDNNNYVVFSDYYTPLLVHNCSHGAGRNMGRNEASKSLDREDCDAAMEDVVWDGYQKIKQRGKNKPRILDLSEAPQAYKDISEVIENQRDLVEVVTELTPLAVLKG